MTNNSPLGEVVTVHGVVRALAKSYRSTIKKSFMTVRKKKNTHTQTQTQTQTKISAVFTVILYAKISK